MRYLFPILNLSILFLVTCCGCTGVPSPIIENEEEDKDETQLFIMPEKTEILDTEPVILETSGAVGNVIWYTSPENSGIFEPPEGERVIFLPNDIIQDTIITIIAEDENTSTDEFILTVKDQVIKPIAGDILINEIGWAGSISSSYDEYIELINKTEYDIYMYNYKIENAAGINNPLIFSGKIEKNQLFLITNYPQNDERTKITSERSFVTPKISLNNEVCGPFILKNENDGIIDAVGDGRPYPFGINTKDHKSSMSRYTWSESSTYSPDEWYTESISINLSDGTLGTPGEKNSDKPERAGPTDEDALGIITEYFIDYNKNGITDWIELFITRKGSIKNFVITDLDNTKADSSISGKQEITVEKGEYICIIWGDPLLPSPEGFTQASKILYIPDTKPTGTKDELVLMISDSFQDGLCYYSTDEIQFDDEKIIKDFGWMGNPIHGKHATRIIDTETQDYLSELSSFSWNTDTNETPGY